MNIINYLIDNWIAVIVILCLASIVVMVVCMVYAKDTYTLVHARMLELLDQEKLPLEIEMAMKKWLDLDGAEVFSLGGNFDYHFMWELQKQIDNYNKYVELRIEAITERRLNENKPTDSGEVTGI